MGFYHCANIPASAVPPHSPRSHGSTLRFRSFRLRFTVQAATVPLHSLSSLNSASRSRQSQLRFTTQAISTPPHCPGSLNSAPLHSPSGLSPGSLNSAAQSKQSQLRRPVQAVSTRFTVQAISVPAVSSPPHSTIQIKYSFPSSLIFCRDFWILMRILSGTPAILFSICSATIS